MPSIKEYKAKISSLSNIEKMTRTMKLVSASKLRQAQRNQANAKLYAKKLVILIDRMAASMESASHPLLSSYTKEKKILAVVITSDKGLCGGFNNNLNRRMVVWIDERKKAGCKVDLSFCGKRGFMFLKKYAPLKQHYEQVTAKPNFTRASQIGDELSNSLLAGEYSEIYLAYNQFKSPLSQTPVFEKLLPIESTMLKEEKGPAISSDYILEPGKEQLLKTLIPRFLYFKIYFALLENSAGEHGARMTAMEKASKNADELIDKYVLLRNRARQAGITKELIEIVSGAEALK